LILYATVLLLLHFQMNNQEIPGPSMAKNPSCFEMGMATYAVQESQDDPDTSEVDTDVSSDPEDES